MFGFIGFISLFFILVVAHEFGHYLAARGFKVEVEKFSIGFGKKLVSIKKGSTDFRISMIPLGGYAKMKGQPFASMMLTKEEALPVNDQTYLANKPVWQRAVIFSSGSVFNLIVAAILFSSLFYFVGQPVLKPSIGSVIIGQPAMVAGVKPDDLVLRMNGHEIVSWETLVGAIQSSNGNSVPITVLRDGRQIDLTIQPEAAVEALETIGIHTKGRWYVVGIEAKGEFQKDPMPFFSSISMGGKKTVEIVVKTIGLMGNIVAGKESAENLSGPLHIAQLANMAAQDGLVPFIALTAVLSASLGVLNLLPIPGIDGGFFLLLLYEAVAKRSPSLKVIKAGQFIGVVTVAAIFIFSIFNDIAKIFT